MFDLLSESARSNGGGLGEIRPSCLLFKRAKNMIRQVEVYGPYVMVADSRDGLAVY